MAQRTIVLTTAQGFPKNVAGDVWPVGTYTLTDDAWAELLLAAGAAEGTVQATLNTGSGNTPGQNSNLITWTSVQVGIPGNAVSVQMVNPGPNGVLGVTFNPQTLLITVTLATNPIGVITSTSTQVANAVNNSPASALVTATLPVGVTSVAVAAQAPTNLVGGVSAPTLARTATVGWLFAGETVLRPATRTITVATPVVFRGQTFPAGTSAIKDSPIIEALVVAGFATEANPPVAFHTPGLGWSLL